MQVAIGRGQSHGISAWVDRASGAAFIASANAELAAMTGVGESVRADAVKVLDVLLFNAFAYGAGPRVWASWGVYRNPVELVLQVSVDNESFAPISTAGATYDNRGHGTLLHPYGAGLAWVDSVAPSWGAAHYTADEQRACDVELFGRDWAAHVSEITPRVDTTTVYALWRWPA